MSIRSNLNAENQTLTIAVEGRFDFSAHKEFRDAFENLEAPPTRYSVDMSSASYIDSSALGMLLLLRDHAGGEEAEVEIVNCSSDVKKILTISNFDQLFDIH